MKIVARQEHFDRARQIEADADRSGGFYSRARCCANSIAVLDALGLPVPDDHRWNWLVASSYTRLFIHKGDVELRLPREAARIVEAYDLGRSIDLPIEYELNVTREMVV